MSPPFVMRVTPPFFEVCLKHLLLCIPTRNARPRLKVLSYSFSVCTRSISRGTLPSVLLFRKVTKSRTGHHSTQRSSRMHTCPSFTVSASLLQRRDFFYRKTHPFRREQSLVFTLYLFIYLFTKGHLGLSILIEKYHLFKESSLSTICNLTKHSPSKSFRKGSLKIRVLSD